MNERRRGQRAPTGCLVAYYWTGTVSKPNVVSDISVSGARIVTTDSFYQHTVLQIILEATVQQGLTPHICVFGRVCRKTADGFCVTFVAGNRERLAMRRFLRELTRDVPVNVTSEKVP
jgi:hypothetical protein